MAALIITFILAYAWLLIESDWLRVCLMPPNKPPKYARYKAYSGLRARKNYDTIVHEGDNYPEGYSPNGEPEYMIVLNPGIDNVLCGWDWLDKHCADLVDYEPRVELDTGGVRYNMTIKEPAIIKDVVKANKPTKPRDLYPVLPCLRHK